MYSLADSNLESNCSLTQLDVEVAQHQDPSEKPDTFSHNLINEKFNDFTTAETGVKYFGIGSDAEEDATRPRKYSFSPRIPANSPVILSWQNLSVTTMTAKPKVLLDNISGSITGGFWAIMGASGGGIIQ